MPSAIMASFVMPSVPPKTPTMVKVFSESVSKSYMVTLSPTDRPFLSVSSLESSTAKESSGWMWRPSSKVYSSSRNTSSSWESRTAVTCPMLLAVLSPAPGKKCSCWLLA